MFIAASSSVSLGWCRVELPAVVSKPAIALHIVYADSVSFLCLDDEETWIEQPSGCRIPGCQ